MEPIKTAHIHYQEALQHALELSGPQEVFFADYQAKIITQLLEKQGIKPAKVLDYGCGNGTMAYLVSHLLPEAHVHGVDTSQEIIEIAQEWYCKPTLRYNSTSLMLRRITQGERFKVNTACSCAKAPAHRDLIPSRLPAEALCEGWECSSQPLGKKNVSRDFYDLIYMANVMHHVPKHERQSLMQELVNHLAPHGHLIILEFNPFNPCVIWQFYRNKEERGNHMIMPRSLKKLLNQFGKTNICYFKKVFTAMLQKD